MFTDQKGQAKLDLHIIISICFDFCVRGSEQNIFKPQ